MRYTLTGSIAVCFLCPAVAPPVVAQHATDKQYLAEGFVAEREFAAQRPFEEAYRLRVINALAATLTLEELDALATDHGSGRSILQPNALGSSLADLIYTPVVPCRIVDTRLAGGAMPGGSTRPFLVSGSSGFTAQGGHSGGCGVPMGATAAVLSIVSVNPSGPGNLRAYAYDEPAPAVPNASTLNYGVVSGLPAIANGTVVPLCDPLTQTCTFDVIIFAAVSSVDVVLDVAGYFQTFPTGDIMATVLANDGTGSGLDADTVDGFDSTAFGDITEVTAGTGLIGGATSGPASLSADLSVMQARVTGTCPSGEYIMAVDVSGAVTCGLDEGVGALGPGLVLTDGVLSVDFAALTAELSTATNTVDSQGTVGQNTSIAIGADGLGLISYLDSTNQDLKVAHCANTSCTTATTSTIDSLGIVGQHSSIAIGTDGLGLISYSDGPINDDLKVAHCMDSACTAATTTTLDSAGVIGAFTSIAIGMDGLGLISYWDTTNTALKVAHCLDTACTSAGTTTLDSFNDVGLHTSVAIGADGLGLISYYDQTNQDLKVAHCADIACTSATFGAIDSLGSVGIDTSIAIGADDLGLISYYDQTNQDLKVAHCANTSCTTATTSTISSLGMVGQHSSIAIGTDGLGLISYYDETAVDLKVAHCSSNACTNVTTATIDSLGFVGLFTSIAVGTDGQGLISYYAITDANLKVAHLGIGVP